MTTGPESPERDPALERAWRAHSREAPPAALDRAILAAAHRAVGSGPAEVAPAREANRPQRWWMPLAAAATIGAVAVGLLQMSPQDASIVAPTERIAAVAPQRELAKEAPAAAAAAAPAPAPAAGPTPTSTPAPAAASTEPAAQAAASAPASRTSPAASAPASSPSSTAEAPSRAVSVPASPAAANEAREDRKQDAQRPPPPPASVVPPMPPRPPAAPVPPASTPGARDTPAVVGKLAERTPDPFPAASAPRKAESAEMKAAAPAADGAASAGAAAGGVVQAARTEPTVAVAEDKRELARKDAAEADRQVAAAAPPALAAPAPPAVRAPAPAGAAAPRAAPPPPAAEMRARENATVRDASREQVAPAASALAKRAAPAEDARTKARDPDAWIAQIRKLRDEGRTAEAIRELRDFREFVPDADRRIPPDLRELGAAVRP